MKRILFLTLLFIFTPATFAQDVAKNTPKPEEKKAPATAIIPKEDVQAIESLRKDAQLAQLQVENLQLKIQQAQTELAKLQEAQKKAEGAIQTAVTAAATKVGIPTSQLVEYEVTNGIDGAWILKKKATEKPKAE